MTTLLERLTKLSSESVESATDASQLAVIHRVDVPFEFQSTLNTPDGGSLVIVELPRDADEQAELINWKL